MSYEISNAFEVFHHRIFQAHAEETLGELSEEIEACRNLAKNHKEFLIRYIERKRNAY